MHQSLTLVLIGILLSTSLYSQVALPVSFQDSVQRVLQSAASPHEKITIYQAVIDNVLVSDQVLARQYIEELQQLANATTDTAALAYVSEKEASLSYMSGNLQEASQSFQEACQSYEKAGLAGPAIMACTKSGIMLSLMGRQAAAGSIYQEQLTKARALALKPQQAYLYNQLGTLYHYQGATDSAVGYYDICAQMYAELADTANLLRPLFNKAVLLKRSRPGESLQTYLRIYAIREKQGAVPEMVKALQAIGDLQENNNELVKAFQSYQQAYQLCQDYNYQIELPNILTGLASLKMDQYDHDEALSYTQEAVSVARSSGQSQGLLNALSVQASVLFHLEDEVQALRVLDEVLSIAAATGLQAATVQALIKKAYILSEMGQHGPANEALREAEVHLKNGVGQEHTLYFRKTKALLVFRSGQYKAAAGLARESYQAFLELNRFGDALGSLELLLEAYESSRQYVQAVALLSPYRWLSDTVNQIRNITDLKVQNQEFEFELEKQQLEAEQAKREAVLQAAASRNQVIGLAALLLGLMGLVFALYTRRQRAVIQRQRDDLLALNQTKDQLFSILGHDLRIPAISFRGIAQKVNFLLSEADYQGLKKFGQQIEEDASQLLHMTENLLQWSLGQRKAQKHAPVNFQLLHLVQDTLAFFLIRSKEKHITINTEGLTDAICYSDKQMLGIILRNILDNAFKFTPQGGTIRIDTAQTTPGFADLTIADSGPGLPESVLKQINTEAALNDSTLGSANEKGFGLGLKLVYSLSTINQTPVELIAGEGHSGAAFRLRIPLAT
jgi:signal transduction histidine kinase